MNSRAKSVADGLLDLVYPCKCMICDTMNPYLICESCLENIETVPRPYCPRCGHPIQGQRCRSCWGRIPSFTSARAVGVHSGVLREAVHVFKYAGGRMLADPLAHLLYRYLITRADFPWRRAECVVPVPIHPARQRVRGYNQSELLAERLSELIQKPLMTEAVARIRHTRPQVQMSGEDRRNNLKGAFRALRPEELRGRNILLVDDVSTTCSTLHECSLALLSAEASNIYAVCLTFDA